MTCKHCKKEFPNDLTDDVDNCILCCDKTKKINSTGEKIQEFNDTLKDYIFRKRTNHNIIDFKDIYFPQNSSFFMNDEKFGTILDISNPPRNVFVDHCTFLSEWNILNDKRKTNIHFSNCKFKNWKITTQHDCLEEEYEDCQFEHYNKEGTESSLVNTNIQFKRCKFDNMTINYCVCNKKLFDNIEKITNLTITNSIIHESFRIKDGTKINKLDFSKSEFKKTVKIKLCEIADANFYNTKFDKLADFYKTKFSNVSFKKTDFNDISVFSEVVFKCDIDFLYTKFLKEAIFQDAVITGKLNLRNSIFKDKANFLDITCEEKDENEPYENPKTIQVANRETARIIKNFYDSSKNIIEANKFYALEMQEREKELDQNIKNNVFEWLVFKAHRISSNHSQDWFLALFWIINLTFLYSSMRTCTTCNIPTFSCLCPIIILSLIAIPLYLLFLKQQLHKLFLVLFSVANYVVYAYSYHDFTLSIFAQNLNPFRNLTMLEEQEKNMAFIILIYKIIIAYLIYQFIISIRQNTKRKID